MKHRLIALMLGLCLAAAPGGMTAGLAANHAWTQEEPNSTMEYRFTTFDTEIPQALRPVLEQAGYGGLPCIQGAMGHMASQGVAEMQPTDLLAALLVLQRPEGPFAVGLYKHVRYDWYTEELGSKLFIPGKAWTLQPKADQSRLCFALELPAENGVTACYYVGPADEPGWPWRVKRYEEKDANGNGFAIDCPWGLPGFLLKQLPRDQGHYEGKELTAFTSRQLRYMNNITDFPTSFEQAEQIAQKTGDRFQNQPIALLVGANVREKPTTSSKALGFSQLGVLATVLGEEPGKHNPWIHLRIGSLECYMAGNYVRQAQAAPQEFGMFLAISPPPVAEVQLSSSLRASPSATGEETMPLEPGAQVHVLMACGPWYYVSVPQDAPDWLMEMDAPAGYVSKDDLHILSGMVFEK